MVRYTPILFGLICAACAAQLPLPPADPAQATSLKYPLHLHILVVDDTHRTLRMQPNWCSSSAPDLAGAGESGPCSASNSSSLGGGGDDFSGAGRADLVSPPSGTVGLNFTYEGCSRIRVAPGFQSLAARWKKQNTKLEVLVPTDEIYTGAPRVQRCTLSVAKQEFVYLRLRNGAIIRVSEDAYWSKPSLRVFLSGGSETLERRTSIVTVKELAQHN